MCGGPDYTPPPPPPMAPPVLDQLAPKSASESESRVKKKAKGLSKYKIGETAMTNAQTKKKTSQLGGLPTKTGANG